MSPGREQENSRSRVHVVDRWVEPWMHVERLHAESDGGGSTLDLQATLHLVPLAAQLIELSSAPIEALHLRVEALDHLTVAGSLGDGVPFAGEMRFELGDEGALCLDAPLSVLMRDHPVDSSIPPLWPAELLFKALPEGLLERTGPVSGRVSVAGLLAHLYARLDCDAPPEPEAWGVEITFRRLSITVNVGSTAVYVETDDAARAASEVVESPGSDHAAEEDPHAIALVQLDRALLQGRLTAAAGAWERLRRADPAALSVDGPPEPQRRWMWLAEVTGLAGEAVHQLRRFTQSPEVAIEALTTLARLYQRQGAAVRALLYLRQGWEAASEQQPTGLVRWALGKGLVHSLEVVGSPEVERVRQLVEQLDTFLQAEAAESAVALPAVRRGEMTHEPSADEPQAEEESDSEGWQAEASAAWQAATAPERALELPGRGDVAQLLAQWSSLEGGSAEAAGFDEVVDDREELLQEGPDSSDGYGDEGADVYEADYTDDELSAGDDGSSAYATDSDLGAEVEHAAQHSDGFDLGHEEPVPQAFDVDGVDYELGSFTGAAETQEPEGEVDGSAGVGEPSEPHEASEAEGKEDLQSTSSWGLNTDPEEQMYQGVENAALDPDDEAYTDADDELRFGPALDDQREWADDDELGFDEAVIAEQEVSRFGSAPDPVAHADDQEPLDADGAGPSDLDDLAAPRERGAEAIDSDEGAGEISDEAASFDADEGQTLGFDGESEHALQGEGSLSEQEGQSETERLSQQEGLDSAEAESVDFDSGPGVDAEDEGASQGVDLSKEAGASQGVDLSKEANSSEDQGLNPEEAAGFDFDDGEGRAADLGWAAEPTSSPDEMGDPLASFEEDAPTLLKPADGLGGLFGARPPIEDDDEDLEESELTLSPFIDEALWGPPQKPEAADSARMSSGEAAQLRALWSQVQAPGGADWDEITEVGASAAPDALFGGPNALEGVVAPHLGPGAFQQPSDDFETPSDAVAPLPPAEEPPAEMRTPSDGEVASPPPVESVDAERGLHHADEAGWRDARAQAEASALWRAHLQRVEAALDEAPAGERDVLLRELAATYVGMGVPSRAIPHLSALIEDRPDDARAEAMLRRIHIDAGDLSARISLDAWVARARLAPEQAYGRLVALADEAASLSLADAERRCLSDACRMRPGSLGPFLRLEKLLRGAQAWAELAELWRLRAGLPYEEGVDGALRRAEALLEGGLLVEARLDLEGLLRERGDSPRGADAIRLLARVLVMQGDMQALNQLETSLEGGGASLATLTRAEALADEGIGDNDALVEAERLFREVLSEEPSNRRALSGLVKCRITAGDSTAAVAALEHALSQANDSERDGLLRELGDIHLVHLGDAARARTYYEAADALVSASENR